MVSYAQQSELDESPVVELGEKVEDAAKEGIEILSLLDDGNIVDELPKDAGSDILTAYNTAYGSMKDWLEKYKRALKLAKMQPKEKKKTFPFEGASTAMAPFILEACIDFNARSAPELAYSDKIVKAKVYGGTTLPEVPEPPPPPQRTTEAEMQQGQQMDARLQEAYQQKQQERQDAQERIDTGKEDRASRVAEFSNYQLSQLMPSWKREQDKLLLSLPCVGTMYKKTYYDVGAQEVRSDLCYGDQIIFDQAYPTFEAAPDRYEELPIMTKNEVIEKIRGPEEWAIDETELSDDDDETYEFVEAHTWFDVDDDGLKEPYCVIVWKKIEKAVYARPMFDEVTVSVNEDSQISKIEMVDIYTQFQFIPDPEGSPMGFGWGILLGPMFEQINIKLRSLIDAGTISNLAANSGIIADRSGSGARGNRSQRGPVELAMGKLTPVQMGGTGSLSQDVVQFPAKGPSETLFNLMSYMVDAARRMTDASSQVDANPNEAAALYMARLQQTLKRPNIIIMRVYDCAAKEFEKIFNLNYLHFSDEKYNRIIDAPIEYSMEQDFNSDDCDIRLVADPAQGSDMERMARAEAVLQNAKSEQAPITDIRQATMDYYEVLGVQNIDILVPEPQGPDPMQEMMQRQQELAEAKEAMETEFKQRDQRLKEKDQALRQREQDLKIAKQQYDAMKEMQAAGLEVDVTEADITLKYSQAFKNLMDVDVQRAAIEAEALENQFINQSEGGLTDGARATSNTRTNPALGS